MTSGKLVSGTKCGLGSGAYRRISLGGGGRGIIGITLRGYEEGIEGVVLTTLERMRMWKRIAFVGNLVAVFHSGRSLAILADTRT